MPPNPPTPRDLSAQSINISQSIDYDMIWTEEFAHSHLMPPKCVWASAETGHSFTHQFQSQRARVSDWSSPEHIANWWSFGGLSALPLNNIICIQSVFACTAFLSSCHPALPTVLWCLQSDQSTRWNGQRVSPSLLARTVMLDDLNSNQEVISLYHQKCVPPSAD